MKYEIHDSHGAPQCGCEIVTFDTCWDLDDYLDEHPDVYERISDGYATIVEVLQVEKFALLLVRKDGCGMKSEKVIGIIECDEETAEGICESYCLFGRNTYATYRRYDGEVVEA